MTFFFTVRLNVRATHAFKLPIYRRETQNVTNVFLKFVLKLRLGGIHHIKKRTRFQIINTNHRTLHSVHVF